MSNKYWYAEALHEDWCYANGFSPNRWDGPTPDRGGYVSEMETMAQYDDEGWERDED